MNISHEELSAIAQSPFGGAADLRQVLPTTFIAQMYLRKCDVDVTQCFHGLTGVGMYECRRTGYRFWRPAAVAGDESLYLQLSRNWPNYYRTERWEYPRARRVLNGSASVLEIGCGRGYFLRSIEKPGFDGVGLEFNPDAIRTKITKVDVLPSSIQDFSLRNANRFDAVCSFQVLEHVVDPYSFLESAIRCLKREGLLVVSTPNNESLDYKSQKDAFDLPPHHMGHFNRDVYERIASMLGLNPPRMYFERRRFVAPSVTSRMSKKLSIRVINLISTVLFDAAFAANHEVGNNMLVVFENRT